MTHFSHKLAILTTGFILPFGKENVPRQGVLVWVSLTMLACWIPLSGISQCSGDDDDGSPTPDPIPVDSPTPGASVQRIAIPAYFYPGTLWDQLIASGPSVGLAVFNPSSGPGTSFDPSYATTVDTATATGMIILGYVHTSYGERAQAEVLEEVDRYYSWYNLSGIFFDEVPGTSSCTQYFSYYTELSQYVHNLQATPTVVFNPGTDTCESYLELAEILVTFESQASQYSSWSPPNWTLTYAPERFWHLIHTAGDEATMLEALARAQADHVGWIYVTDDGLPNPWDTLPVYWEAELGAL